MILIDLLLPCLSFFLRGKLVAAFIAMILQITIIGWIFASIWAILARRNARNARQLSMLQQQMKEQNTINSPGNS
jgi:threonine/homoserine/homoserine lactone efflux protein